MHQYMNTQTRLRNIRTRADHTYIHTYIHTYGHAQIMKDRAAIEKASKSAFSSGRHYLDTLFTRQKPELAALAGDCAHVHMYV